MNNFKILNILNSQIVKPKNLSIIELNDKYLLCIPAFIGYHRNLACSIFITLSDKIKSASSNEGLYKLINAFYQDISSILVGNDEFEIGKDYYISESLYNFLINIPDPGGDDSSYDDSSTSDSSTAEDDSSYDDSSSDSSIDDSSAIIDPDIPDPDKPTYQFPPGIVVIAGPDVNYTLSLTYNNVLLMQELLANNDVYADGRNSRPYKTIKKKVLKRVAPYIAPEVEIDNDFTDEEENTVDDIIKTEFILPDYIRYYSDFSFEINDTYYVDLSDLKNKDFTNIDTFINDNDSQNKTYTKEELEHLPSSFFTIILDKAVVQNYYTNINNQIYNVVMNYWKGKGQDCASSAIDLILGTLYATSTTTTCGCNGITQTDTSTESCKDMYNAAMLEWLAKMLGDKEYYYDWFYIPGTGECPDVNIPMIDMLITLLREFIAEGHDLSFSNNSRLHCQCPDVDMDNGSCNYAIIENYIKVLMWVKNNNIEANANKINIYGSQFGTLLPKLIF